MILVTGRPVAEKTTHAVSRMSEINTVDQKIITVEDPVEYRLPASIRVQVNENIDLTFSVVLAPHCGKTRT